MRRVEQVWRLTATGLSFAFFGLGGLLLSVTAFPLINLLVRDSTKRSAYAQWLVHKAFRLHVLFMVTSGAISVKIFGAEKLQQDSGTLIVANHPSLIDVVLLISVMKQAQCIVKAEIWENPFMRGVVTAAGYIRNDGDPERLIDLCAAELAAGKNIVIFPEGTRTVPGVSVKLQRGVANIAIRAKAPIRLVSITCEPPILMKGQKWYQIPLFRSCFTVRINGLIEIESFIGEFTPSVAARHLNEYLAGQLMGATGLD